MDKDKFKDCFTARKAAVERVYPGAFDFLADGWDFLLMMSCLFLLYYYAVSPKIDKLLGKDSKEIFDFGTWIKDIGTTVWKAPIEMTKKITDAMGKK